MENMIIMDTTLKFNYLKNIIYKIVLTLTISIILLLWTVIFLMEKEIMDKIFKINKTKKLNLYF